MCEDAERWPPNYKLLEAVSTGSDRMISTRLGGMLRALVPGAVDRLAMAGDLDLRAMEVARVRAGLHEALDYAAYGALASDFVMQVLDIEWRRMGGSHDDPAPWRKGPPWSDDEDQDGWIGL